MRVLTAGNIHVGYHDGFLRYFKLGDCEALRMIYFAVRNANWENVPYTISGEDLKVQDNAFQITYLATFDEGAGPILTWEISIAGTESGEVNFSIDGTASGDFRTNRAGFCVLFPIEGLAGTQVKIRHAGSAAQVYEFPKHIAPYQPFIDVTGMEWHMEGQRFRIDFEGDIFEAEDQRNWGDASYKVYCTPLKLPFPRQVRQGERICQRVSFKPDGNSKPVKIKNDKPTAFNRFELGTAFPDQLETLSPEAIQKLKKLHLDHFRLEISPGEPCWEQKFFKQSWYSNFLETGLELVVNLTADFRQELDWILLIISDRSLVVKNLTLLSSNELVTTQQVIDYIPSIRHLLPASRIGVGTRYNFTELNRNRFNAGTADYISLAFDPQEHAADDLTIMENAATPAYFAQSLNALYGKPVHISPIALKRRFNPYATDASEVILSLEKQLDPRQQSHFLNDWIKILFENLEQSKIQFVTLFQATGELGLMDQYGNEYPVYDAIEAYAARNQ